jgi:hypothetical protein
MARVDQGGLLGVKRQMIKGPEKKISGPFLLGKEE